MLTTANAGRLGQRVGAWWLSVAMGTLGSLGIVLEGSSIGSNPQPTTTTFWPHVPEGNYALAHVLFYVAVALLLLSWCALGVHALQGRLTTSRSWLVLFFWGAPLFIGTPVFSRDVYSYIAQGELVRRGLNPYIVAPRALGPGPLLSSIASVWRDTTSPYGPLFVTLTHLGVRVAGESLIGQVLVFRALEVLGVVLLMVTLPALARHFGANEGVAVWLGVLSPLSLFSAISSAHNDTLMLGLIGVALVAWLRGGRRWGLVLFSLAATIKLPALAGVAFLTAGELRGASPRQRWQLIGESIALTSAVFVGVTQLSGFGWTWLGPTALHIPTELRVLITPSVSVGAFLAVVVHAAGATLSTRAIVTFTQQCFEVVAVGLVVLLLLRSRRDNFVRMLGVALLVVVLGSPTVWPWYLLWGLTVLGATGAQRWSFLIVTAGVAMLLVGPGGTPMIGGNGCFVTAPLIGVALFWFFSGGHWRVITSGVDRVH